MSEVSKLRSVLDRNAGSPMLLPAGAICVLEGLVALGFAVASLAQAHPERILVTVTIVGTMVPYGVALLFAAWGLWRHRGWARGIAVCAQLLHLPIAWSFLQGASGLPLAIGIAIAVVSVAGLVCIFWPSSTRTFADPNGPAGQH